MLPFSHESGKNHDWMFELVMKNTNIILINIKLEDGPNGYENYKYISININLANGPLVQQH